MLTSSYPGNPRVGTGDFLPHSGNKSPGGLVLPPWCHLPGRQRLRTRRASSGGPRRQRRSLLIPARAGWRLDDPLRPDQRQRGQHRADRLRTL